MMQKFLTKYWLAFLLVVLFVSVSVSMLNGNLMSGAPLFWLSLLAAESLLLLPTVFKDESIGEARKRVFRSLEGDAFTYVGMLLAIVGLIQWLNSGCTLEYLVDADIWKFSMPPVEWLPYSIKPEPALEFLSVVVILFSGCLLIRNGLGKGGKRFFLDAATVGSGMIALFAAFTCLAEPTGTFARWVEEPEACNPGTFFAFWFLMGLGRDLSSSRSSSSPLKAALWWCFSFVGNLTGLVLFNTGIGVVVYGGLGVLLIVYRMVILVVQHASLSKQFRFLVGVFFSLSLVGGSVKFLFPPTFVVSKVKNVMSASVIEEMSASRQFRMNAAFKIWEDVPWTGVGAQGFSQYLGTVIEGSDWKLAKADKQYVWNDAFQFLCEWGVIGVGILVAIIITMLIPLFIRLRNIFGRSSGGGSALETFLSFDDYVVPTVVVIVSMVAYGWFSSPFQSRALFISWFFVLAVFPGLLPTKRLR